MWYLMATEKGGVLFPEDEDPLSGTTVTEALDFQTPSFTDFQSVLTNSAVFAHNW